MSRRDIYYWKCDRPAAFHGTQVRGAPDEAIAAQLREALRQHFSTDAVTLRPTASQGNHLTWSADVGGVAMFLRVENGPEQDDHLAVESTVMQRVREVGVLTPRVHGVDATRDHVPFAWQALERIEAPDLNHWQKQGQLDVPRIAHAIGAAVAQWQEIRPTGFGPFDSEHWRSGQQLVGYHPTYEQYFRIRLEQHLNFLVARGFLSPAQREDIVSVIEEHRELLHLDQGCLVHKDLALWNILGTSSDIAAFIDFDDAISGDPMDDLSLLACFHDAPFLERAFAGYQTHRPLPAQYLRRFWLHLLRNMIVKAVIRVGAGYFDRSDSFFLIGSGSSGSDLKTFTSERITKAVLGLREELAISSL